MTKINLLMFLSGAVAGGVGAASMFILLGALTVF